MEVVVPDLGDFADVEIIDILVKPGDKVSAEQGLVTLETEKATMDVPSPAAGKVGELKVKVGDRVSTGHVIMSLETAGRAEAPSAAPERPADDLTVRQPRPVPRAAAAADGAPRTVAVPDLGDFAGVEIIEILVKPGDRVKAEQGLVTLETEKASMDVPAPEAGEIVEVKVKVGERVSAGDVLLVLKPDEASSAHGALPRRACARAREGPAGGRACRPSARRTSPRRRALPGRAVSRARRRASAKRMRAHPCAGSRASSASTSAACAARARRAA